MTYAIFTEDGAIMATFHRQHREDYLPEDLMVYDTREEAAEVYAQLDLYEDGEDRGAYIGLIVGSVDDYEVE